MEFLEQIIFDNSAQQWLIALGVVAVMYLAFMSVRRVLVALIPKWSRRTDTIWDDVIAHAVGKTKWLFLMVVAAFVGANLLDFPDKVSATLRTIVGIAFLVQVGVWLSAGLRFWIKAYREEQIEDHAGSVMTMNALSYLARIVLWSVILMLVLDNVGVDVTALLAGLGVAGVAVALAVQNILGDLFASLSIVLDKPFVLGDFVVVGDHKGSIEKIGIKTTRVRSLSGEQLIFSNNDLLTSRIQNFGRMQERRVLFTIGVTYQTPKDKHDRIPQIIKQAIDNEDKTRFDRSHFFSYGDFALIFETVYFVLDDDYKLYMDIQHAINMVIFEKFAEDGIEFAYPTQTLFVQKQSG